MRFKRAVQRYGQTPEPETPYQRAGQLWDERIGAARVQAKNWRLMAFGGLLLTAGLSSALIWQSMQSHVVPYVVEVDTRSEEHTSELQSLMRISYAVFCLKKKKKQNSTHIK